MKRFKKLVPALLLLVCNISYAGIQLPQIFTDNMVLQRDGPVKIWGTAEKNETITVAFNKQKVRTKTNEQGEWMVELKAMPYGGPYDMQIRSKSESIMLKNILMGDVWLCSGQSNMEWIVKNVNDAEQEIAAADYAHIRLFTVPRAMALQPQKDLAGGEWMECNSKNIAHFSAVAYFFARKLHKDLNIPIGLINSSWGGTNIQTWTSWDVMGRKEAYKNADISQYEKWIEEAAKRKQEFLKALELDRGSKERWYEQYDAAGWKKTKLPNTWEATEIGTVDGIVWFSKELELPASFEGKPVLLSLGPIDDIDSTYINGQLIGTEKNPTLNRVYQVPAGALKKGKNRIVIKVTDTGKRGGFHGMADQLFLEAGGQKVSVAGEWAYKPSVISTDYGVMDVGPNGFPSKLYNAMIAPIIPYRIKGATWYQGESNAGEAYKYRVSFPEMINDWRSKWGYEFPFLWVQLANYMLADSLPSQSEWAELREAQHQTLALPQTGEAVTIDIGEAKDIHPRNKKDVGTRLALAAEKIAYGKNIVFSGPRYESMKVEGHKIILHFTNIGSGMVAKDKYGYLKGFAIAGTDQRFTWATAQIEGDSIIVYSDAVANPIAVRYAWGNNPDDANLYNKEGLPASPFRTDKWPGITEGKSIY